eukprot:TRINITY_DN841_c0_g1_i1.p1 TRINITY_DN841_c0_g1~~TRINITY_DN841_c0_g1_i1.p1  ORF type:complete len:296 (-),score=49.51 TRINITY_DN841_c0_g1_i1:30-917(-)
MSIPIEIQGSEERRNELKKSAATAMKIVLSTPAFSSLPRGQHPIAILTSANSSGFRPLHFAASSNNLILLQTLLDLFSCFPSEQARLLIDCRDRDGNTALHWAVMSGSVEAFTSLIKAGATVNIANFEAKTALHLAVSSLESLSEETSVLIVSHLLHFGANPNVSDEQGVSPLHVAAELGNVALIDTLIEEGGASVNVVDHEGETALFYALRGQHDGAVRKLLEHGIDFHARNSDGESASDFCNSYGDTEMVEILESALPKTEALPILNPRSLSMELSESCTLSASGGAWFSSSF